jgi:hypothetical protein
VNHELCWAESNRMKVGVRPGSLCALNADSKYDDHNQVLWLPATPTNGKSIRDLHQPEMHSEVGGGGASRVEEPLSIYSSVHRGVREEHVKCLIRRERSSLEAKMYPTYHLLLEHPRTLLMTAKKMKLSRTSNYHLFDMTRGVMEGAALTKKSGNYVGKLRARNTDRSDYVFVSKASSEGLVEELAGVTFNKVNLLNQYFNGTNPRKMRVIMPPVDNATLLPAAHLAGEGQRSLIDMLYAHDYGRYFVFETREPSLEGDIYRLDFGGRVTVASVKNFQVPRTVASTYNVNK